MYKTLLNNIYLKREKEKENSILFDYLLSSFKCFYSTDKTNINSNKNTNFLFFNYFQTFNTIRSKRDLHFFFC